MTPAQQILAREMSEADLLANVVARATQAGWRVAHINDGLYRLAVKAGRADALVGAVGFPDLVLAREGRVVFAELKSARGKIRPEQSAWLNELLPVLADAAHQVYIWRPAHLFDGTIDEALGVGP